MSAVVAVASVPVDVYLTVMSGYLRLASNRRLGRGSVDQLVTQDFYMNRGLTSPEVRHGRACRAEAYIYCCQHSRPGPVSTKMCTGRAKCTVLRTLAKFPRQVLESLSTAFSVLRCLFRTEKSFPRRIRVETQRPSSSHKVETRHQTRWVRLQHLLIENPLHLRCPRGTVRGDLEKLTDRSFKKAYVHCLINYRLDTRARGRWLTPVTSMRPTSIAVSARD
jgi:hypothetical protein